MFKPLNLTFHKLTYPVLRIISVSSVFHGRYMKKVYCGEKTLLSLVLLPAKRLIYRICGVDEIEEMTATFGSHLAGDVKNRPSRKC